jgi:hypothetical protein
MKCCYTYSMDITKTYIGGWFQRTTLHLSEIYDFLKYKTSALALDAGKLKELHTGLDIVHVELLVADGLEHIIVSTSKDISYRIYEDGLIVLSYPRSTEATLKHDIEKLTHYYETKLSPAFSYLFSLGAPVPKELANIKTVYPYFVVIHNAKKDDAKKLLADFGQEEHFAVHDPLFDIYRGDKLYIIANKKEKIEHIERFIEEQIFLREFKGQLHRYLYLHRIIWEKIAEVKERGEIKGSDVGAFKDKIDGYAKTINLIESRIAQMGTYLKTRERIAKELKALESFSEVIEYRYETLGNTLAYIQHIWTMTKNYVNRALDLFKSLQDQATQSSIKNLAIITSMGVAASIFGLFKSAPTFTIEGSIYVIALVIIGFGADSVMKWMNQQKKFKIKDIEFDKEI